MDIIISTECKTTAQCQQTESNKTQ